MTHLTESAALPRHRITQRLVPIFAAEPSVVAAYGFGPALDGTHPDGDLNLGLVLDEGPWRQSHHEVAARITRASGWISRHRCQAVILNDADAALARQVLREGMRLFVADDGKLEAFMDKAAPGDAEEAPGARSGADRETVRR